MSRRLARALGALAAVVAPALAFAQSARVAAEPGPGGTVVGRVCLDLNRDGACSEGEPGVGGARLRFEDGRLATADDRGRFHAVDVATRLALPDRSAYGAHAVSVDGLGVARRFELAPRGAVSVELPVTLDVDGGRVVSAEPRTAGAPRVEGDRVVWLLGGGAAPGAWVRGAGVEARAGPDGRWTLSVALGDGGNSVDLVFGDSEGAVELWRFEARVARPASGALRVYPSRPRRLAVLRIRLLGDGAVLSGTSTPGVEVTMGGRPVRASDQGHFAALASGERVALRMTVDGVTTEVELPIARSDGSFRGVLLGELELQAGGEAGFLASGRIAASASARWRGFELDAGVDLDDRDGGMIDLASPRDAVGGSLVIDPRRAFVEAGDDAGVEDANPGRGRLWARAEGGGLRLELGTSRTGIVEPELGRYDRQLFGGRVRWEGAIGPARVGAVAFGSRAGADSNGLVAGAPCQDQLAATGGSLYYLSRRNLVVGSERVRVEWRDPVSRLTVASRELARGRDYDLDAVGGRLLLARPLASTRPLAALSGGEPFAAAEGWLVVDYLRVESSTAWSGLAGGELRAGVGPVILAAGGASESRPGEDWQLARGSATLDLGAALRARVDFARSEGALFGAEGAGRATSLDGGFSVGQPSRAGEDAATGIHARVDGEVGPARWQGWWRERSGGYSDGTFSEPVAARERGVLAEAKAGPVALRLGWAERRGADPLDPDGVARRDEGRAFASAALAAGPIDLSLEGLHERATLPERGAQSAAGVRAGWRVANGLRLEAGHLQSFATSGEVVARTFSSVGASVGVGEGALALHAGWGPDLGPRLLVSGRREEGSGELYGTLDVDPAGEVRGGGGSAVGGRQRLSAGTLFTEQRVARDSRGVVSGRVVGAALAPARGLSVVLSGEHGERWLDGEPIARSAGAISAAWGRDLVRLDGRAELRGEGGGRQWLAGAGAEWTPTPRLALSLRALASDGEIQGRRARGGDGWLSAAWRCDALTILARLGRVKDAREGIAERDATVAATALTARLPLRAKLGVGVDYAHQRIGGARDNRLAASLRGELRVAGPADVALEYARRGSLEGREIGDLDALRAEAGVTTGGVRLALGYTLVGFRGAGLDPEEERDGRFYLRAVLVR